MGILTFPSLFALIVAQSPVELNQHTQEYSLINAIQYWKADNDSTLSSAITALETGKFTNTTGGNLAGGYGYGAYWFAMSISNSSSELLEAVLLLQYANLDRVTLYEYHQNSAVRIVDIGDHSPIENRSYKFRYPNHQIQVKANGARTFLIKITSTSTRRIDWELLSTDQLPDLMARDFIFYGIYFGILLGLFLFNLVMYLIIRDISYIFYLLSTLSICLLILSFSGIGFTFLWDPGWYQDHGILIWMGVGSATLLLFTVVFFRKFISRRRILYFGLFLVFTQYLLTLLIPFLDIIFITQALTACGALNILYVFVIALYCVFAGVQPSRYFIIAWSVFLMGVIYTAMANMGAFPIDIYFPYALEFGNAIEMVLFSIALGDRISVLKKQKDTIEAQLVKSREIVKRQKIIDESLNYASRIQASIIPSTDEMNRCFGQTNYFIIWEEKEQVGGDFYWLYEFNDQEILFGVFDCTGHGVPGAFMTMLGNGILNSIAQDHDTRDPAFILTKLNEGVNKTLHLGTDDAYHTENAGMDGSLFFWNKQQMKLTIAGAKGIIYVIHEGHLEKLKLDRQSIGGIKKKQDFKYKNTEYSMAPGDTIYLLSDGIIDQPITFDSEDIEKFGSKRLRHWLNENYQKPMPRQYHELMLHWEYLRGTEPQIDDVTVFGFRYEIPSPNK